MDKYYSINDKEAEKLKQKPETNLVMYITEDGLTKISATFDEETVWLSLDQMADLFQKNKSTISRHIKNIFTEGELVQNSVVANYATSVDYDPHSNESIKFFKIVQNKLHFAAHGHTATEVIYKRANAKKPFMGLTAFSGELPTLKDIGVAKNYLNEDELRVLNNLVSGYFDLAEISAIEHRPMYMKDYIKQLDAVLVSGNRKLLENNGSVSHMQAMEKAKGEYRKYQVETIAPVEKAYLETVKSLAKDAKNKMHKKTLNNS